MPVRSSSSKPGAGAAPRSSELETKPCAAIVLGVLDTANAGTLRSDLLWAPVLGRPLLAWAVAAVVATVEISASVLVVEPSRLQAAERLLDAEGWHAVRVVAARSTLRCDVLAQGLAALPSASGCILVHECGRPLVTSPLLSATREGVVSMGCSVTTCEPVKETLKQVQDGFVAATVPRAEIVRTQTPQGFPRAHLAAALACPTATETSDAAAIVLAAGYPLKTIPGSSENLSVTTPDDLPVVEALLARRQLLR